jgi:transcription initiation factor TFIID subunit TAF12
MSRVRSDEILQSPINNDSILSISKISITSNSYLEKFLRSENDQLTRDNDLLKEKIKSCERKERDLFQQLKDMTIKYDKLSLRCSEIEGLNELNEMLLH